MINVNATKEERNFCLTVEGHANSDEKGKDIVCASASMLAYTLAFDVISCEKAGLFNEEATVYLEDGMAEIKCSCKNDSAMVYVRRAFLLIAEGFKLLGSSYPEYVEVNISGF